MPDISGHRVISLDMFRHDKMLCFYMFLVCRCNKQKFPFDSETVKLRNLHLLLFLRYYFYCICVCICIRPCVLLVNDVPQASLFSMAIKQIVVK